ncbi:hypothetical protein TVAG_551870 [Trichomonas vaginalis G3]|uniref:Uncharacterized protein n=1 Tax=Trichomonas vaginalis (strain ATCC PRA-98 / G3) TaxID=412133 RepID=A2FX24_TRIV3|nr:armadillo (ARM) repeat-containing protein family [Trichomonas vaginalis G3]EAX90546.1 hypothetical protein TVAG_551870 [Trichomonas vaginalis G3]KAI5497741.1 armadillo (ARM) repeat-containing protein family [Trichomonas vaginalis G3]|eukprot:XP_001303476.1 hypothetical protein [Trichomonas vaginalis G3]
MRILYQFLDYPTCKICLELIHLIITSNDNLFSEFLTEQNFSRLISSITDTAFIRKIDEVFDIIYYILINSDLEKIEISLLISTIKQIEIIDKNTSTHVFRVLNALVCQYFNENEISDLMNYLINNKTRYSTNTYIHNEILTLLRSISSRNLFLDKYWTFLPQILLTDNTKLLHTAIEFITYMAENSIFYENINIEIIFLKLQDYPSLTLKSSIFNMFIALSQSPTFSKQFIEKGFLQKIENYLFSAEFDLKIAIFSFFSSLMTSIEASSYHYLNYSLLTKAIAFSSEVLDDKFTNNILNGLTNIIKVSPIEQHPVLCKTVTDALEFDEFDNLYQNEVTDETLKRLEDIENWILDNSS